MVKKVILIIFITTSISACSNMVNGPFRELTYDPNLNITETPTNTNTHTPTNQIASTPTSTTTKTPPPPSSTFTATPSTPWPPYIFDTKCISSPTWEYTDENEVLPTEISSPCLNPNSGISSIGEDIHGVNLILDHSSIKNEQFVLIYRDYPFNEVQQIQFSLLLNKIVASHTKDDELILGLGNPDKFIENGCFIYIDFPYGGIEGDTNLQPKAWFSENIKSTSSFLQNIEYSEKYLITFSLLQENILILFDDQIVVKCQQDLKNIQGIWIGFYLPSNGKIDAQIIEIRE